MKLNELTPEEEKVIVHKGTEKPFSGEYERERAPESALPVVDHIYSEV